MTLPGTENVSARALSQLQHTDEGPLREIEFSLLCAMYMLAPHRHEIATLQYALAHVRTLASVTTKHGRTFPEPAPIDEPDESLVLGLFTAEDLARLRKRRDLLWRGLQFGMRQVPDKWVGGLDECLDRIAAIDHVIGELTEAQDDGR